MDMYENMDLETTKALEMAVLEFGKKIIEASKRAYAAIMRGVVGAIRRVKME